jgi:hypothetical protein
MNLGGISYNVALATSIVMILLLSSIVYQFFVFFCKFMLCFSTFFNRIDIDCLN